jgi:DNA-binding MarR family transcriptional regulator
LSERKKPEHSPFRYEQADDSPGFLLWKLVASWQGKHAAIFDELAITQTQYAILASLLWFEQQDMAPSQATLGEHARIDKMTLSKAIRKLEERVLVRREASVSDARALHVRFTAAGRKLVQRAIVAVEKADDEFFSCLSEEQLATWKRLAVALSAGGGR